MKLKEYVQDIFNELTVAEELLDKLLYTGLETTGEDEDPIADEMERAFGYVVRLSETLERLAKLAQPGNPNPEP